jgi:general secretion pathway protein D
MQNGAVVLTMTIRIRALCIALMVAGISRFSVAQPPPAEPSAPPVAPVAGSRADLIDFNFDQVDIGTFVKLVGGNTGRKFVLGDGAQGKITVVSPMISRDNVYPLFVSILESSGFSVVQEGDISRIVPLPRRDTQTAPVLGVNDPLPTEGLVTKVIRLNHVTAAQVARALEGRVGGGKAGGIAAIEETNHLLVTDTAESIRRIEKIIQEIDRPGMSRLTEVVPLRYASADDLASQLNLAVSDTESRAERMKNRLPDANGQMATESGHGPMVVASSHANSLVLVGNAGQLADMKKLIAQMDVDTPLGRGRFNAIFLKYLSAQEAATNITALLTKSVMKDLPGQKIKIAVEASVANNALLVDASPSDFEVIKKLVGELDQLPAQVHISVQIIEISASTNDEFGVEMAALAAPTKVGDTVIQGSSLFTDSSTGGSILDAAQSGVFPKGITVGMAYGSSLDADGNVVASYPGLLNITALKKRGRYEVLSDTSLEAQNNKEATVSIVNDIPILKSTVSNGTGDSREVIQNIERMDVGIQLKLTPHIIPGGEVQMVLNPSIEAVIDPGPTGTDFAPTIAKREVTTTVTVLDGRTIVIAGLTRNDHTLVDQRVPFLGSIPLLGRLFRNTVDSTEKTDLLILVTPRVQRDARSAEALMNRWEKRTGMAVPGRTNEPAADAATSAPTNAQPVP